MDERRRHPRIPAAWPVRLQVDEETVVGRAVDVSAYGVLVTTAPTALLKVGHSYWVELVADKGNTLVALGEVRHVSGKGAGLRMMVRLPV
ncbi:MAG: PilZ domain-containing protein [Candidatus Rokubacteria bacterium]|nr:PilZ domain-containing protein [Candidatus Rokubacteria bacterium]